MFFIDLSSRNQITLPAEYRRRLGLKPKDRLAISVKNGQLILRKAPDFLALKGFLKGMKRIDERASAMDAAFERSMGIRPNRLGVAQAEEMRGSKGINHVKFTKKLRARIKAKISMLAPKK